MPPDRIPFLVIGDGPTEPSGLSRIARDLVSQILRSDLPFDVVQAGGATRPLWTEWRHVPLQLDEDWGATDAKLIYEGIWGRQPGILFCVWDPSRIFPYLDIDLPVQKWAYTAVDAQNISGGFGGPAGAAIQGFDRVLAYGRYGRRVLNEVTGGTGSWLPHGIALDRYRVPAATLPSPEEQARDLLGPHAIGKTVIGCVMTNQPRKDFGLLFHMLQILRQRKHHVYLWLHTDRLVKYWAVQQLVSDLGLVKQVTVTTEILPDTTLAALYKACAVTVLPSLGEGFGYPIVESLACGTPVVHTDYAEGANLIPRTEWRVPVREWRIDGAYALLRPVMRAEDWANAVERALGWRQLVGPAVASAYCQGAVAHLDWQVLWPRWYKWFERGING